jgi:hypothetical protein
VSEDLASILEYLAVELLGWGKGRIWWSRHTDRDDEVLVTDNELRARLLTGNGMLEIIEAMQGKGWEFERWGMVTIDSYPDPSYHEAGFSGYQTRVGSNNSFLPEAVARAAYAALMSQKDG